MNLEVCWGNIRKPVKQKWEREEQIDINTGSEKVGRMKSLTHNSWHSFFSQHFLHIDIRGFSTSCPVRTSCQLLSFANIKSSCVISSPCSSLVHFWRTRYSVMESRAAQNISASSVQTTTLSSTVEQRMFLSRVVSRVEHDTETRWCLLTYVFLLRDILIILSFLTTVMRNF